LAYHQRIVDVVPENFKPMCPIKPEPQFKFKAEADAPQGELEE